MHDARTHHTQQYLSYLDAVRGIAATWVMLYHYINMRFYEHSTAKIASLLFNGETTILLFVLSGFVLSYKHIVLNHPLDIRQYYIQRFLRFWPAFFIAVLINYIYHYRNDLNIQSLFTNLLYNKGEFWQEALMIRYNPSAGTNPQYYLPGWALVVQLSMSFFLPFMIALANRNVRFIWWMIVAVLLIGNNFGKMYSYHIHYAFGLLISCYFLKIESGSLKNSRWYKYRYIILLIGIFLFSARQLDRFNAIKFFNADYKYWLHDYLGFGFSQYSAISSLIFLTWIIQSETLKRWMNKGIFRFMGKISYGLYLMHWVVVVAIFDYWANIVAWFPNELIATVAMLPVCVIISTILATIIHYWVELPTIRLSKKITGRLKPSFVIKME